MAGRADAMAVVQAGLCERVDRLTRGYRGQRDRTLAGGVAALAATATEFGLQPLADLSHALGLALAGGARGHTVRLYLHAMRDAAGCERADAAAGQAYLASVGSRLAG